AAGAVVYRPAADGRAGRPRRARRGGAAAQAVQDERAVVRRAAGAGRGERRLAAALPHLDLGPRPHGGEDRVAEALAVHFLHQRLVVRLLLGERVGVGRHLRGGGGVLGLLLELPQPGGGAVGRLGVGRRRRDQDVTGVDLGAVERLAVGLQELLELVVG